jgi:hypothetical protein
MRKPCAWSSTLVIAGWLAGLVIAAERTERFDRDPGWEGRNNRATAPAPRTVRQDFGYSPTAHAGGRPGELGGFITPAAEPAYYAKKIPARTFADPLTASGSLACTGRQFHVLIGFFNAGTLNEWRTPNTVALRLSGRGDVFYAWLEYATSRWRAGGDQPQGFSDRDPATRRVRLKEFAGKGAVHRWSLRYDPQGNGGLGVVMATLDGETAVCHLAEGHKADGATFDRFGLLNVMKSAAAGGEVWLDDVTINGDQEDFRTDPGWEGRGNRRTYETADVRPRFDFGYSPTHFAGGAAPGELGGRLFRGDCRYPERMASYADRLEELTLDKPLRASGTVSLRRGVTDSSVLIGFFHSRDSMAVNPSQESGLPKSFLGVSTDGPSREGFFFAPTYRTRDGRHGAVKRGAPYLYPDGVPRKWSLRYAPEEADGRGRITLTLGERSVSLDLGAGHRGSGTRFDRFGFITTWIDGNGQQVYFDDLTYTWKQDQGP